MSSIVKLRKKPVVIRAIQFTAHNGRECVEFCGGRPIADAMNPIAAIMIDTLEGTMAAHIGDWIFEGVKGEFYPCRDDIKQTTHDEVEE